MAGKKGVGPTGWIERNANKKYKTRDSLIAGAVKMCKCTKRQAQDKLGILVRQGRVDAKFASLDRRASVGTSKAKAKAVKVPTRFKSGVDVSIVKDEYDDEGKIAKGIENLGTQVIKDNDFRQELGVPNDRWKVTSNLSKFSKYRIELRGKQFKGMYWGAVEVVEELRKAVDML